MTEQQATEWDAAQPDLREPEQDAAALKVRDAKNGSFQTLLEAGIKAVTENKGEVVNDWRVIATSAIENRFDFPATAWVYRGGHHIAIIQNGECCGTIVECQ
jgi:hypothetical protein